MERLLKKQYHMLITGLVQGVNFRAFFKIKAQSQNLSGWIKNLPNGNVETVVEGKEKNYKELEKWCYKGNHYGRVEDIKVEVSEKLDNFTDMEIIF